MSNERDHNEANDFPERTYADLADTMERGIIRAKEMIETLKKINTDRLYLSFLKNKETRILSRQYITVTGKGIQIIGQANVKMILDECCVANPNGLGARLESRDGTSQKVYTEHLSTFVSRNIKDCREQIARAKDFLRVIKK